ncbi:carbamoyltransferase HypF [Pseudooceanicola sp. CBS1P-1]|uniref:Carbamoyltransferase HypF n=1 Tax=Pseudooceanicola albus TaxID=2692189 RepID=A0A6L7G820_9RHOB|nr:MULTISPECIES: carbamoyltransferase HypF [Pseudooceanicola]MBT9384213.1 carbamoyltransferase HypF [Pseudooceanicola endophyticus]MXN19688.1 carbamoyltransferase HypF [Pseudooceanicola albus]
MGRRIRVRGQVQGVGFRPFVWQLARRFGLTGWVRNDAEGVLIEVSALSEGFEAALRAEAPPLARVDRIEASDVIAAPCAGFEIRASGAPGAETRVAPDAATCPACVEEIFGTGRRHGYAFTNCTHCGPRFTILTRLPYDRAQTTMAAFDLCPACAAEYGDPADRRFHAQPIACPDCGPRLWCEGAEGGGAIEAAAALLRAGGTVAIKGLGGFHLACDATDPAAIAQLRSRKHRPAKPFALMAPLEILLRHAAPSEAEIALLKDPAAPIVLLAKTPGLPEALAPGQATLGWMLPYTPLHHLLLAAVGRPLVMTSGNLSGEPQVIGNAEAREKLAGFADAFLMHDREIARRLDDSVERITPHGPMVLRRARGRVPATLPLPAGLPDRQVTGYGGQMKAALCLSKNGQLLLGHHLGELNEALTWEAFLQADRDYAALFDHTPEAVACDLHPGFRATQHAEGRGLPVIPVQHHHAHLAACLGENLWPADGGKVAGIVLDGLGLGPDGTLWGGEILLGDYHGFTRAAHLAPAPLVGGDAAQAEPWRNALVRLDAAGLAELADRLFPEAPRALLRRAAATGMNAPLSSSAGRLFDAVAAILGLYPARQSFEGEAAMRLEALAGPPEPGYPMGTGTQIDPAPLFQTLCRDHAAGLPPATLSARFHAGLAEAFATRARTLVETGAARAVALTGGCFQNARLLDEVLTRLQGVPVLIHRATPANDGSLALGQVLIALAQLEST